MADRALVSSLRLFSCRITWVVSAATVSTPTTRPSPSRTGEWLCAKTPCSMRPEPARKTGSVVSCSRCGRPCGRRSRARPRVPTRPELGQDLAGGPAERARGAARRAAGRTRRCRSAPGRRRRRAPSAWGTRRRGRPAYAAPGPSRGARRGASAPTGTRRAGRRCPRRPDHRRWGRVGWEFARTCLACPQPSARRRTGMDRQLPECRKAFTNGRDGRQGSRADLGVFARI